MTPHKTTGVPKLIVAALTRYRPPRHDRHTRTTPEPPHRTPDPILDGTEPDPSSRFHADRITRGDRYGQPRNDSSSHASGTEPSLAPAWPATPAATLPPAAPSPHNTIQVPKATERPSNPVGTIRLLGRYSIEAHTLVTGQPREAWMLIALLAEYRQAPLPRTTVIERLWPDQDPQAATGRFWTVIKEARTKLCQALLRPTHDGKHVIENLGAGTYRLNQGLFHADVWRLRDALAQAHVCPHGQRAAALATAVGLYSGPYLPGADYNWARSTAHALDRDVIDALTQLADLEANPERAAGRLEHATRIDPTCEHLFRRRMHLYADQRRYQAIHNCYAELTDQLHAIGAQPEQRTTQLYRRLISQAG